MTPWKPPPCNCCRTQGELADNAEQRSTVFEVAKMDTSKQVAQGNTVVVFVKWSGKGKATGKVRATGGVGGSQSQGQGSGACAECAE